MRNQSRGMTLIEVLVAFVLLSVTLAVILQIFTGGMRNARLADSYSRAVFLAESKLSTVGVERPLLAGDETGQIVGMQWHLNVRPANDDESVDRFALSSRLYKVTVRVAWSEDGLDRQVALESLRIGVRH